MSDAMRDYKLKCEREIVAALKDRKITQEQAARLRKSLGL
jgi:hypothetical protein